jgi:hypothetical protein
LRISFAVFDQDDVEMKEQSDTSVILYESIIYPAIHFRKKKRKSAAKLGTGSIELKFKFTWPFQSKMRQIWQQDITPGFPLPY